MGLEQHTAAAVSAQLKEDARARAQDQRLVWGIPWGFNGLDQLTGGIHQGQLSLIAARPGVGKSFFVGQVAVHVAEYLNTPDGRSRYPNQVVKLVLCEMDEGSFQQRLICQRAKVNMKRVKAGRMTPEQHARFDRAADEIAALPIRYLDSPVSLDGTRKWLEQGPKCAWWCVDYVGIHPAGGGIDEGNPYRKVSFLSGGFRDIARYVAPGLLVCQLSRKAEAREDKRPQLADLRDSGNLEQDASGIVMAIYRPDIYLKTADVDRDMPKDAELLVLKARNSEIGTVNMFWSPTLPGFVDNSALSDDLEFDA